MTNRIVLTLEQPEYSALLDIAIAQLRTPADQVRWMVRQELERTGKLMEKKNPIHTKEIES